MLAIAPIVIIEHLTMCQALCYLFPSINLFSPAGVTQWWSTDL